ncbi:MAG: DUF6941 family protein [Actinomycetota bacterium]
MKLEVLMMANSASLESGLLNVQGVGWEFIRYDFFPAQLRGAVCGIITLDPEEIGTIHVIEVTAKDEGGIDLGWRASMTVPGDRPRTKRGVPIRQTFAVPLAAVLGAPTVVRVALECEGDELGAVTFEVQDEFSGDP